MLLSHKKWMLFGAAMVLSLSSHTGWGAVTAQPVDFADYDISGVVKQTPPGAAASFLQKMNGNFVTAGGGLNNGGIRGLTGGAPTLRSAVSTDEGVLIPQTSTNEDPLNPFSGITVANWYVPVTGEGLFSGREALMVNSASGVGPNAFRATDWQGYLFTACTGGAQVRTFSTSRMSPQATDSFHVAGAATSSVGQLTIPTFDNLIAAMATGSFVSYFSRLSAASGNPGGLTGQAIPGRVYLLIRTSINDQPITNRNDYFREYTLLCYGRTGE